MKSSLKNEESREVRGPQGPVVMLVSLLTGIIVVFLLGSSGFIPPSFRMAVGLVIGLVIAAVWYELCHRRPLRKVADALRSIECGDLSQTVPEIGSGDLRAGARVVNSIGADFQEVLLLFAHLVRSGRTSAELLRKHILEVDNSGVDRIHAETVIKDIDQMGEMISDFKYFRVRVENGSIVDTGIAAYDSDSSCTPADTAAAESAAGPWANSKEGRST